MIQSDPQTKEIEKGLKEGERYYAASRTIQGEWPKMATRGNGKGKKPSSKACANQSEFEAYMSGGKTETITEE